VIASYVIGELGEADQRKLAETMWTKARHALVVIEPGTPAGYARILALRQQLIAAGAYVVAPCPHERHCPLIAPDWCHFNQRLPRSQAHRQIKGAEVPFEDERFIYVALTRAPSAIRTARVLAPPDIGKAEITAKLCTQDGVEVAKIPRRDKAAYAEARRWRWGDAVMSES
jgi:ribosomal protein RSM22 (predicted rRNA methylase)